MANYGYSTEDRHPGRDYTPSHSDDELPQFSGLSLGDKNYRLFSFRKDGRSWVNAVCSESSLPESEIKKKAKRQRKASHGVQAQLEKMSVPRKNAIEDLLDQTTRNDRNGDRWDVVAIDNDRPDYTKRTGEVLAFSVILARLSATRQRTNSGSQERRRSGYIPPMQEYAVPERRGTKTYNQGRQSPSYDNRTNKPNQSFRNSQNILEEDPFGSAQLFSQDGKPVNASGTAAFSSAGLPPHIQQDEPIGAPLKNKKEKMNDGKVKKPKAFKDSEPIDLDALFGAPDKLGAADLLGGVLDGGHHNDHDDHDGIDPLDHDDYDFDSPIEVISDHDDKRGRGQYPNGWGAKTPRQGHSRSKSKSKPRRPSLNIPKDDRRRAVPEVTPGGKRRPQPYWSSRNSATTAASIQSDQSVLEAEYEEYSSSGSSGGIPEQDWQGAYMPADGRYVKANKYHRAGPPSPKQFRYEPAPAPYSAVPGQDPGYFRRRPSRSERFPSDSAVTRYSYTPNPAQRPPIVSQTSAPRFTPTPTTAHPASGHPSMYNTYDSAFTPFPSEVSTRESLQQQQAELYMRQQEHDLREKELLQRERDFARQQVEFHQDMTRRASVSMRQGGAARPKYNHEPRLSRRFTEQSYHG